MSLKWLTSEIKCQFRQKLVESMINTTQHILEIYFQKIKILKTKFTNNKLKIEKVVININNYQTNE